MNSRDFCYWLQGYFEILGAAPDDTVGNLCEKRVTTIKNHLAMVFKHEIDPSFGGPEIQKALSEIHEGNKKFKCDRCDTVADSKFALQLLMGNPLRGPQSYHTVCRSCFDKAMKGNVLNC